MKKICLLSPGAVTSLIGTLVCNPGNALGSPEMAIDTRMQQSAVSDSSAFWTLDPYGH